MIFTSIFGGLISLILYIRYACFGKLTIRWRILLFLGVLIIGALPLLMTERVALLMEKYYPFYVHTVYFVLITLVMLLTLTIITDIIWGIGILILKSKMIPLPSVFVLIGLAFILSGWSLYEGMKVPAVKTVTITSDKITKPTTLVFLSDLHIHRTLNPRKIEGIIEQVNALHPDIVILGGDTVDDSIRKTQDIADKLKEIQAPQGRFFVAGNHEFYRGFQPSINHLKSLGYTFLENSGETIGNLYIAGIPDLRHSPTPVRLSDTFKNALPTQFRILVSHTPADFGAKNSFDLALSGHTHGGQIFPFHFLADWHNGFLNGLYELQNNARLYVSRGSGQWGPQMRFLAPSEITVIQLQPQQQGDSK